MHSLTGDNSVILLPIIRFQATGVEDTMVVTCMTDMLPKEPTIPAEVGYRWSAIIWVEISMADCKPLIILVKLGFFTYTEYVLTGWEGTGGEDEEEDEEEKGEEVEEDEEVEEEEEDGEDGS